MPVLEDPARLVHVDCTEDSAHMKHYLKDGAEELSKSHGVSFRSSFVPRFTLVYDADLMLLCELLGYKACQHQPFPFLTATVIAICTLIFM